MSIRVGIGLGSNLGDRLANLRRAREKILAIPGVVPPNAPQSAGVCLSAPVYETEPIGCPEGSAAFLNTVVEVGLQTRCRPLLLLRSLRQIEKSLGRPSRYPRNSPRCIDLDILYAGQLTMVTSELRLPHPRLHTRWFVLKPLADIRAEFQLPGTDRTVCELLQALDGPGKVEPVTEHW